MTLSFHPAAKEEFREAAVWYAGQRRGLGDEFIAAVEQGRQAIQATPLRFPLIAPPVRRYALRRFPYRLHYL